MAEDTKHMIGKKILESNPWEIQQNTASAAVGRISDLIDQKGVRNQINENGLQPVLDTAVEVSREILGAMTLSFDTENSGKRHTKIWGEPIRLVISLQKAILGEMGEMGYDESQMDTVKRGLEEFQEEVMAINPQLILDLEKKEEKMKIESE